MSLNNSESTLECADCSNPVVRWASVNRGILICDECCIIHRNLGRKFSQIKSIEKSIWSPSELQMVMALNSSGSNTIWEYNLITTECSGFSSSFSRHQRKKPTFPDSLYSVKADFIKAKYQDLAFMKKLSSKDELNSDLSEQLHSSVRSSNLKTSLRLLAFGADPNYLHPEKGNTPLHVAAKSGQLTQIELLVAYGADPLLTDVNEKTPIDYAKSINKSEIVERLIECQFQVTNRFSHFLCGRKPDHKQGQHYFIPQIAETKESSELKKVAKSKLFTLTNKQFEEIAKDVYDEVDRRELDEIWLSQHSQSSNNLTIDYQLIPFLPVDSSFSSIRNQGRQKLARYSAQNFTILVLDILKEAKKRQICSLQSVIKTSLNCVNTNFSDSDDSDPLYDSVASEDDEKKHTDSDSKSEKKSPDVKDLKRSKKDQNKLINDIELKYLEMEKKWNKSTVHLQELLTDNKQLRKEILSLKITLEKIIESSRSESKNSVSSSVSLNSAPLIIHSKSVAKSIIRPSSMFEKALISNKTDPLPSSSSAPISLKTTSLAQTSEEKINFENENEFVSNSLLTNKVFPSKSEILKKTEHITKAIQEMLRVALDNQTDLFKVCGQNILTAVQNMISLFPLQNFDDNLDSKEEQIYQILNKLESGSLKLMMECISENNISVDKVIQCAYDIAKAAKHLVTCHNLN